MFKFVAEASSSKINKTGLLQIQKQRELIIGRDKKFELKLTHQGGFMYTENRAFHQF